jgi:hypothetical protein
MQVLWVLYNPAREHYDALIPTTEVDMVEVTDLQKKILNAAKDEARQAQLWARQLRTVTLTKRPGPPAEAAGVSGSEDEGDAGALTQSHQGLDYDGIVRDLAAYLAGDPSVASKCLPLVFPLHGLESNSSVPPFISVMPSYHLHVQHF